MGTFGGQVMDAFLRRVVAQREAEQERDLAHLALLEERQSWRANEFRGTLKEQGDFRSTSKRWYDKLKSNPEKYRAYLAKESKVRKKRRAERRMQKAMETSK